VGAGAGNAYPVGLAAGSGVRPHWKKEARQLATADSFVVVDKYNGTWFLDNGLGAYYEITDITGTHYYYYGTICGDNNEDQCEIHLLPGQYIYRVDGVFDPKKADVEWEFCGVEGTTSEYLVFEISCGDCDDEDGGVCVELEDDYVCKPIKLYTLDDVCDAMVLSSNIPLNQQTVITLAGSIDIRGASVSALSKADEDVIKSALDLEFSDANKMRNVDGMLSVTTVSSSVVPVVSVDRKLDSELVHRVDFQVKVVAEKFGVDGKKSEHLNTLVKNMHSYLGKSMSSGIFVAKVVALASTHKSEKLQSVKSARLVELSMIHELKVNEQLTNVANMVVVVGALVGLAFGVMIYQAYRPVPEHTRVAMDESASIPQTVPSFGLIQDSMNEVESRRTTMASAI
jgi:response regulator RpfG family c-di-GMP phosphodiesterase